MSAINNIRLPSILSWEFDDVSSVGHISDSESVEDDNNPHLSLPSSHQKPPEPVIEEDCAKVFLQIGRPSYLQRNLTLAYQQLNIPVEDYLHIYTDYLH